jgi:hypothetical protein
MKSGGGEYSRRPFFHSTTALNPFWRFRGHLSEGRWLDAGLAADAIQMTTRIDGLVAAASRSGGATTMKMASSDSRRGKRPLARPNHWSSQRDGAAMARYRTLTSSSSG